MKIYIRIMTYCILVMSAISFRVGWDLRHATEPPWQDTIEALDGICVQLIKDNERFKRIILEKIKQEQDRGAI